MLAFILFVLLSLPYYALTPPIFFPPQSFPLHNFLSFNCTSLFLYPIFLVVHIALYVPRLHDYDNVPMQTKGDLYWKPMEVWIYSDEVLSPATWRHHWHIRTCSPGRRTAHSRSCCLRPATLRSRPPLNQARWKQMLDGNVTSVSQTVSALTSLPTLPCSPETSSELHWLKTVAGYCKKIPE